MKRLWLLLGVLVGLGLLFPAGIHAQITSVDDDFEDDDPCLGEWTCLGDAVWVSPDALTCIDGNDTTACQLFNPPEGYVRMTPTMANSQGAMWRGDESGLPLTWDNFRLTAEVELTGNNPANAGQAPADGMTITIVGSPTAPAALGNGGGGMGATNLGAYPTMIFEFDNWNNGGPDRNNNNHVGFEYSATGYGATDQLPSDAFAVVPVPLNGSGKFEFEVVVKEGTVACNLTNEDAGLPKTRMYTYKIPGFAPFNGYLGVTGSTGDAMQNHILHSIRIDELPPGFCLQLPLDATRSIATPRVDVRQVTPINPGGIPTPVYQEGDVIDVSVTLTNIRPDSDDCNAAGNVIVTEYLPAGWTADNISDGGTFDAGAGTVTWNIVPTEGQTLTYEATAVGSANPVNFSGTFVEDVAFAEPGGTQGDTEILLDTPFSICGGIRTWNILGFYDWPGAANANPAYADTNPPPESDLLLDYMTDGDDSELDFLWFPGAVIFTDFGGAAASTTIGGGVNGWNPGGNPVVFAWNDLGSYININDDIFGGDPNNSVCYAQCYVINTTGAPIEAYVGVSSDDAVAVIWNEEYHWVNPIARGGADACTPQDHTQLELDGVTPNDPIIIETGENVLVVKTFEIAGGFNFSLRLEDELENPITEGLEISLVPEGFCVEPPFVATRTVDTGEIIEIERDPYPVYTPGSTYDVTLAITDVRGAGGDCAAASEATITETVPAGWTVSGISDGGSETTGVITWSLTDPFPAELSYQVTAATSDIRVDFEGLIDEPSALTPFAVEGDGTLFLPSPFSDQGFIKTWLLLGPYEHPTGLTWGDAPTVDNLRLDFLTDGDDIYENDWDPIEGDTVDTDFLGASPSPGLMAPLTAVDINPGGVPTWAAWWDKDDTIFFNTYYGGAGINYAMMYAVVYVELEDDLIVDIGLASDDSVQVLLDDEEIWINSIPRDSDVNDTVQDLLTSTTIPQLNPLGAGVHKIMVKVFDAAGDHDFRLRFQDPITLEPITEGITVCLDPDDCGGGIITGPQFGRGDADANGGAANITDGIYVLNFLFLGGPPPPCQDAADADDNGAVNITDGIYILNFLFLGGPPPPAPAAPDCGEDTTASALACDSFPPCE